VDESFSWARGIARQEKKVERDFERKGGPYNELKMTRGILKKRGEQRKYRKRVKAGDSPTRRENQAYSGAYSSGKLGPCGERSPCQSQQKGEPSAERER